MNDIIKRPAPALALGETLLRMLADPNIPAEKMQIVLNAQKDIMAENRREQFYAAFAMMMPEMPQVERLGNVELIKDGKRLGGYKYARWEDMDRVIRPIMHKYGFGFSFAQRIDQGKQVLVATLLHASGHALTSERPVIPDPGPGRNAAQAEGSGLSYAKRYAAEGLLNIVRKGVDDDAIAAGLTPLSDSQVKDLTALIKETKTEVSHFLSVFVTGIERLENIPARDYPRLKNALEAKKQTLAAKKEKK